MINERNVTRDDLFARDMFADVNNDLNFFLFSRAPLKSRHEKALETVNVHDWRLRNKSKAVEKYLNLKFSQEMTFAQMFAIRRTQVNGSMRCRREV